MKTTLEIIQKRKNRKSFSGRVYDRKKRPGFYTIHPVGSLDANAYPIIERKTEQILKSAPEVIIFDMQHLNYINSQGLRVILKVQRAMKPRGGRVVLINLQPHIKEVFDIINALPAQRIFVNREELDNYLDAMQNHCVGASQGAIRRTKPNGSIGAAAGALTAGA
ncbi:MAG: STAS domain-containing protein [Deltaproteobacteria bacterium]|nr:STAS domain-containing protein [Deltaproteobacteria bacterium]